MELANDSSRPHVIIIPYAVQGHVTPMLHLAELLCLDNLNVTFLSTPHIHKTLSKTGSLEDRFSRFKGFRFQAVPDGLPHDHPRTSEDGTWAMVQGFASNAKRILKESTSAITCLIVDGWLTPFDAAAKEANIPVIAFRCFSAVAESAFSYIPHLIQKQSIPFKDEDMDCLVEDAPGMESVLRYRDLPSFSRIKDKLSCQNSQGMFSAEEQKVQQAHGLILNTFEDLEGPILSLLRSKCSKVYSIGPLHAHVEKRRLGQGKTTSATMYNGSLSSSSFFEEDSSCLSWLDKKPDKSVVYVSFGSSTVIERKQLLEFWTGLVQSNKYFLWVIRHDLVNSSDNDSPTPPELLAATEERGCIVSWSPQEAVLTHRAIGGFLTHSGWNSTLESIVAGVPMICWPYFADQLVNSRFVSEVWRIGLDMKDTCDRNVVQKMIHDVMDARKEEFQGSMTKMSELAKKSISEGGSSYNNLDCLIHDIRMMSVKAR